MENRKELFSSLIKNDSLRGSGNTVYTQVDNDFTDNNRISSKRMPSIKEDKKEENKSKKNEVPKKKYIYNFKIIIVGGIGVGKTSVIERYVNNRFIYEERPSISGELKEKMVDIDLESRVNLKIVDTAGEERFMSLSNQYFKDCQGAIVMYDLSDKYALTKIKDWLNILEEKAPEKIVIVLAGNKSDLFCLKADLGDELKEYKEKYDHYEISAKTGSNVSLVFDKLIEKIVNILKEKGEDEIVERRESSILEPAKKKKGVFKKIKKIFSKC